MKKFFFSFLALAVGLAVNAQYTRTLPLDYNDFFRADAIAADGTHLEKAEYANTAQDETNPIMADQWNRSGKTTNSEGSGENPTIAASTLEYSNYIDNKKGSEISLLDLGGSSLIRSSVYSLNADNSYTGQPYYLAALVQITAATGKGDFLMFDANYTGNAQRGRLYANKEGSGYKLGLGWNGDPTEWSGELAFGSTHLVVIKITPDTTGTNEGAVFWIDPNLSKDESDNTPFATIAGVADKKLSYIRGITVRQRTKIAGKLAGLRFGTSWAEVVKNDGSETPDEPEQPETDKDIFAVEDFEYEAGSAIEGQGGWEVSTKTGEQDGMSPMVGTESLTYAGYGSGEGGALVLDSVAQKITGSLKRNTVMPFVNAKLAADEVVYTAFLINLNAMNSTSGKDIFTYMKQGTAESTSTTMRGRVHVKIDKDKMVFGIHKNSQEITQWSDSLDKAETALLVVKYVNKSTGSTGAADEFYLYVNPDPSKSEAENAAKMLVADGNEADGGTDLRYLCFRQMKLNATFDGIRVAKTWEKALNYKASQGIEDVQENAVPGTKILRDGQLLILRGDKIYTITGQQIQLIIN